MFCPHRFAPLSMGKLKGDSIECGYHGMTFDCTGRCIRIPGQEIIPANAKVRSYPISESMGLAWIWMGAPEKAAKTAVYDLAQYHDSNWSTIEGDALPIACHYLSLADNLCDPAHVSFVHLSTLGNAASEDVPVQFEKKAEDQLLTWRWIIDGPASAGQEVCEVHRQRRPLALLSLLRAEHCRHRLWKRSDRNGSS